MLNRITQMVLVLGVVLGILLPKSTAFLAQIGVIQAQIIVICTGDGLQHITLNEDGEPVEVSLEMAPCAFTDAVDGLDLAFNVLAVPALFTLADFPRPNEVDGFDNVKSKKLPRAPPYV